MGEFMLYIICLTIKLLIINVSNLSIMWTLKFATQIQMGHYNL